MSALSGACRNPESTIGRLQDTMREVVSLPITHSPPRHDTPLHRLYRHQSPTALLQHTALASTQLAACSAFAWVRWSRHCSSLAVNPRRAILSFHAR